MCPKRSQIFQKGCVIPHMKKSPSSVFVPVSSERDYLIAQRSG